MNSPQVNEPSQGSRGKKDPLKVLFVIKRESTREEDKSFSVNHFSTNHEGQLPVMHVVKDLTHPEIHCSIEVTVYRRSHHSWKPFDEGVIHVSSKEDLVVLEGLNKIFNDENEMRGITYLGANRFEVDDRIELTRRDCLHERLQRFREQPQEALAATG